MDSINRNPLIAVDTSDTLRNINSQLSLINDYCIVSCGCDHADTDPNVMYGLSLTLNTIIEALYFEISRTDQN